jgi:hypothetical protein
MDEGVKSNNIKALHTGWQSAVVPVTVEGATQIKNQNCVLVTHFHDVSPSPSTLLRLLDISDRKITRKNFSLPFPISQTRTTKKR